LLADLVGPRGRVLGVDHNAAILGTARARAQAAGWQNVTFRAGDAYDLPRDQQFDAIVGRWVLMHTPEPVDLLRSLAPRLRPGGIIAFQELAMPLARSFPEGPLFSRCIGWIIDTIEGAGFEIDMGGKLPMTFAAAGLPMPQMNSAALAGGGPDTPLYNYLAETLRSLLPMAERVGVTTAAEVQIDTLAERLRQEAVEQQACVMTPPYVGAWTKTPA
jgi:ubiquinone/menaquinone biosynthesis C-methylase UbiE